MMYSLSPSSSSSTSSSSKFLSVAAIAVLVVVFNARVLLLWIAPSTAATTTVKSLRTHYRFKNSSFPQAETNISVDSAPSPPSPPVCTEFNVSEGGWHDSAPLHWLPTHLWDDDNAALPVWANTAVFLRSVRTVVNPIDDVWEAQCQFNPTPQSFHFPHALQLLYACLAYFQEYPQHHPVLLVPPEILLQEDDSNDLFGGKQEKREVNAEERNDNNELVDRLTTSQNKDTGTDPTEEETADDRTPRIFMPAGWTRFSFLRGLVLHMQTSMGIELRPRDAEADASIEGGGGVVHGYHMSPAAAHFLSRAVLSSVEGDSTTTKPPLSQQNGVAANADSSIENNSTADSWCQRWSQRRLEEPTLETSPTTTTAGMCLAPPHLPRYYNHTVDQARLPHNREPRIGILNRKGSRRILNAPELAETLQSEFQLSYRPRIMFFEKTTFVQQVEFWGSVDILVSSHGAQVVGLPLLGGPDKPCGAAFLEIFPKGHCGPFFYGSLTVSSGIHYSYLSMGHGLEDSIPQSTNSSSSDCTMEKTFGGRVALRGRNFCLPLDLMVQSIRSLVERWNACCCPLSE